MCCSAAAGALLGSRGWGVTATLWGQSSSQGQPAGMAFSFLPCAGAFLRCCLLGLAHSSPQDLGNDGAQGHPHPPALRLCTSPLHCWLSLLLSTGWCWARNLVLSSTQFLKTILCLRTIQQEIWKVNSVLSLICSLLSQVLAFAGSNCRLHQLLRDCPSRFPADGAAVFSQGSLCPFCSVSDSAVSSWAECHHPAKGPLLFHF